LVGYTALKRIVRNTMPSIRKPARRTDVCSHCKTFRKKLVPKALAEFAKRKTQLQEILPDYFQLFDADPHIAQARASAQDHEEVLRGRKFVLARNNNAQRDEARRGLTKAQRLALFECEAKTLHKLKGHCELLEAYSWHKLSAERQGDFGKSLLERLGPTEAYFHFDFKENVRYPMSKEETGDEWHAQNKLSLTVFGCVVSTPGRKNFHFLLVSEVLDHDSQMARMLLSRILEIVSSRPAYKWDAVQTLHLVSDCGPHFRSRESYAFFLHDLPKLYNVDVAVHFQGEQHGKGPVDRLFGWGCAWIDDFLQEAPIHGIGDLVLCYRKGAQHMVNVDPNGPKFHIESFDPGELRPEKRTFFYCSGFLITRTYCLTSTRARGYARGLRIVNKVFSNCVGQELRGWTIEERTGELADGDMEVVEDDSGQPAPQETAKRWRRGFYQGEKSWEKEGPKPGDVNEVVRRYASQKSAWPAPARLPQSELERALSSAALRLEKAAAKKRRQTEALRVVESSSSSSFKSSSDSDESASE
jgi:hypothetical protein